MDKSNEKQPQQPYSIEYIFDNGEKIQENEFVATLNQRQLQAIDNAFN